MSTIASIVAADLKPIVKQIDEGPLYPEAVLRALGGAGAFTAHVSAVTGAAPRLRPTIEAMATAGRECLSTAFCMWCQSTLAWYADNTDNEPLRQRYAPSSATALQLGGTGLSNPVKSMFGIEKFRLKGRRVEGGYIVKGGLPWVSNIGPDHVFGTIFNVEGDGATPVMIMVPCNHPGVSIHDAGQHLALDGTGTYAVQFKDAFIPDDLILDQDAGRFVKKVAAGFILLQMGMAFGVVRGAIDIQRRMEGPLGHVNRFLDDQPAELEAALEELEARTWALCEDPHSTDPEHWRGVLQARLDASHLALRATQAAMLFSGARGYVRAGDAQRRLREAYFVAIVTPATKQLKLMLAGLEPDGASKNRTVEGPAEVVKENAAGSLSASAARGQQREVSQPVLVSERQSMTDTVLITPEELSAMTASGKTVVIDTRDPKSYAAGHIPGAVNMHEIFTYLATSTPEGMAELMGKFGAAFGAAGLSGAETAVIYEQSMASGFGQSCRGYFLLQALGYTKAKVLHGGLSAWTAKGLPLSTAMPTPVGRMFPVAPAAASLIVDKVAMKAAIDDPAVVKLDVRDVDEWIGESSSPYGKDFCPRKGRLPGARWLEWYRMMKPTGVGQMFKSRAEILAECATVGITPDTPVVLYCFKGARASNTFVALKEAGIKNVSIYFGSWNEWSRDPSLPIEEGAPGIASQIAA